VMLFPDTFNNFFEPGVAMAAVEVLERAGFRVTIPPRDLCCGRPLYDQGMLDRARSRLREIIEVLGPAAARGIPIVGLEPSCLLTFRDEMPSLFPDHAAARKITENSLMLDEFLAREGVDIRAEAIKGRALLHGHCHQKAIAGIDHEVAIISKLQDLQCDVLDAGCCGMAGAFGYDREHYEISRTLANRALIPAIEKSSPDTIVIADGFSCRTQVRHFLPARRVMHLAEALNASSVTASS
jgi:Fe-S oxidoreductase